MSKTSVKAMMHQSRISLFLCRFVLFLFDYQELESNKAASIISFSTAHSLLLAMQGGVTKIGNGERGTGNEYEERENENRKCEQNTELENNVVNNRARVLSFFLFFLTVYWGKIAIMKELTRSHMLQEIKWK